jgi:RNase_H superfamily
MAPKILLFDLETTPLKAWIWDRYETDAIAVEQESYLLCYAAKWLDGRMMTASLPNYRGNKEALVKSLWRLLDEADIVVAHNGDQFDIRKSNAFFSHYSLPPPSPYKTVDTLKVARKYHKFSSNKLDDLGEYLGYGKKIKTDFSLWQGCMDGDTKSWEKMIQYNKRDVVLLERIFLHFRPWIKNINVAIHSDSPVCPKCGSSNLMSRGFAFNVSTKYQRYQCRDCRGWSRSNKNLQIIKPHISL